MDEVLKIDGQDKLTCEQLLVMIEMWMDNEWDLFHTIKDWVDVDYQNRKQHLDSLMSHVRFSLLTQTQLKSIKKMKMYNDGTWRYNVQLGEEYHSRPMHRKMMRPTSVRNKPQVVCFDTDTPAVIYALEEDGKWAEIDLPEAHDYLFDVHAVIEFNNFLIFAADHSETTWHVFDVSTFKWSKMRSMKIQRSEFALVHDDRFLYALGGSVNPDGSDDRFFSVLGLNDTDTHYKVMDTIERYDPATNTWTVMKTKLPKPLTKLKACVCSGPFFSIYVAGGRDSHPHKGEFSTAMYCFNPYEEPATWHRKAPMLAAGESHMMQEMAFKGKDPAIFIVYDDLVIQYYDLKTNQWSSSGVRLHIDKDLWWHKNGTILPDQSDNTLYILNIIENFPISGRKCEQGVCEKWRLSKLDKTVPGCSVDQFPVEAGCWGHCAAPNYIAGILAIPPPSKRKTGTGPPSRRKVVLKPKRPSHCRPMC